MVGIVHLTKVVEQDSPAFEAQRLVGNTLLCQVVEEAVQKICVPNHQSARNALPCFGVVESVEQP